MHAIERSEFSAMLDVLMNGHEGEIEEVRALQLLADRGGTTVSSHSRVRPALPADA